MIASKIWGRNRIFLIVLLGSMVFLLRPAFSATVLLDLYVRAGQLHTVDGRSLPALCYTLAPAGNASLPAPIITVNRGDELQVTLHNQDDDPHGFEVVGINGKNSSVAPGSAQTFTFSFWRSGTWLYRDPVNYPVHQGVGLAGAIEVVDGSADYDREFLWLLGDHSEEWMTAHAGGQLVDTSRYHPDYFTVNGLSGTETNSDPRAHIVGNVGDELLIRVVNAGLRLHSLHFHGYHVDVIARNGFFLRWPLEKDTIAVPVGGTAEFVLRPHQAGVFPIHDHVVLSVAANGVYPLGMIVFTDIQE
jgi:FtsP/CotA-like multicopper oxidase with cupredoxin domain